MLEGGVGMTITVDAIAVAMGDAFGDNPRRSFGKIAKGRRLPGPILDIVRGIIASINVEVV
ncbi:MAG: hypothetical protein ABS58_01355 [Mesorhizobium sp. SCN 65-20]|nr:MAG: hypothetical protein ABS58_01355 [Mesorhizobium sp. SCN 65-20]